MRQICPGAVRSHKNKTQTNKKTTEELDMVPAIQDYVPNRMYTRETIQYRCRLTTQIIVGRVIIERIMWPDK